jgi:gluconolactonase
MNKSLEAVVGAHPVVEKLAGEFGFTEGPVWAQPGFLLFSDLPSNAIMRWHPQEGVSEFRKPNGYDANNAPPGTHIGSNGLTLDSEGRLIICEHGNRRVTRLEKEGTLTVLADRYEGSRLNSPCDVVMKSDGGIYFSDPPYGLPERDSDPAKELPFSGIYRLFAGKLELLCDQLSRPNGMALSPDEKFLYVANSDPQERIWMRFDVSSAGTLSNGVVFHDAKRALAAGVPDGVKVDTEGNVYCTGPGGIWIFSVDGAHIETIEFPELPANCCFGDQNGKMLYVTARTGLYRIRVKVEGIRP